MTKLLSTFLVTFLFSVNFSFSQLYTTTMYSHQELCTEILSWPGVDVVSVNYYGNWGAIGYFDSQNANVGINKGLIMTTGTVLNSIDQSGNPLGPHGPNNRSNAGIDNGQLGNPLLSNLTINTTYNAAVLEIVFIAQESELELTYVFGSEEYPEYVCTKFNDVFGIFISGPGYQNNTLLSTVPETSTLVHVNTVNSGIIGSTASDASYCSNIDSNWQSYSVYY